MKYDGTAHTDGRTHTHLAETDLSSIGTTYFQRLEKAKKKANDGKKKCRNWINYASAGAGSTLSDTSYQPERNCIKKTWHRLFLKM